MTRSQTGGWEKSYSRFERHCGAGGSGDTNYLNGCDVSVTRKAHGAVGTSCESWEVHT